MRGPSESYSDVILRLVEIEARQWSLSHLDAFHQAKEHERRGNPGQNANRVERMINWGDSADAERKQACGARAADNGSKAHGTPPHIAAAWRRLSSPP